MCFVIVSLMLGSTSVGYMNYLLILLAFYLHLLPFFVLSFQLTSFKQYDNASLWHYLPKRNVNISAKPEMKEKYTQQDTFCTNIKSAL